MPNGASTGSIISAGRVPGRNRINTGRDYEVRYWTARLGCTAEVASVSEYVAGHRNGRRPFIHMRGSLES